MTSEGLWTFRRQCAQREICVNSFGNGPFVWTTGTAIHEDYSRIGDEWPETLAELRALTRIGMRVYTHKYASKGVLLLELSDGGTSLEVDPSDRSIWIAGEKCILRYSGTGYRLSACTGLTADKTWLAVVP